jgi:hydrogenase maturation protein HypF
MVPDSPAQARLKLLIRGAVQGVGFRPFVFRLATSLGLSGWVNNSSEGVFIEVEGVADYLKRFLQRVELEKPPLSSIHSLESSWLDSVGYVGFEIRESTRGRKTALVLPDIATCADCLRDITHPANRRYFYPFTNCTNCGPRFSIIESLPYDRADTSMKRFRMCPECQSEYENPRDRRFHAQPNACPHCGPHLELWSAAGQVITAHRDALEAAAKSLAEGKIVAVKGLGGFHLMVRAGNATAVRELRNRKHREEKPFAIMFPSLESIKTVCELSPEEERLLRAPEAPIVLVRSSTGARAGFVTETVAPNNPNLGVMLPYTPLHHLLLSLTGFPLVATSGNLSDEPICIDEKEALERLGSVADLFLVHNRPIVRHVDDSIARIVLGREIVLRRARGYAPLPVRVPALHSRNRSVLAVGAHLKNTVALSVGDQIFISQHIGDLETPQAYDAFLRVTADLQRLYDAQPEVIVADAHPDYLSTHFAHANAGGPAQPRLESVQHHLAHVFACMAENEIEPPVLGVSWDGTGYGLDGTVWGGEFFEVTATSWKRMARLRPFRLAGGDAAVREPRRSALGLLYELRGDTVFVRREEFPPLKAFSKDELRVLSRMLARGVHAPLTSSIGRLFDAVASLLDLRQVARFEGQAAMQLEFAIAHLAATSSSYPITLIPGADAAPSSLDWAPLIDSLLADRTSGLNVGEISARFHNGLVEAILAVARKTAHDRVLLTGGCFQNRYLTERAVLRLQAEGFRPYWHQRVPPNDGGISLGQVIASLRPTV